MNMLKKKSLELLAKASKTAAYNAPKTTDTGFTFPSCWGFTFEPEMPECLANELNGKDMQ